MFWKQERWLLRGGIFAHNVLQKQDTESSALSRKPFLNDRGEISIGFPDLIFKFVLLK